MAIVTGRPGGIGSAVTKLLGVDRPQIVVHYGGSKDKADGVVAEIPDTIGTASAVKADNWEPKEMAALFEKATEEYGGVDVVVHSTGMLQQLRTDA